MSGNPGGRPKGFARLIREATQDGEELVRFMLGVLRGRVKGGTLRDRVAAASWLADRGFGKPPQAIAVGIGGEESEPADADGEVRRDVIVVEVTEESARSMMAAEEHLRTWASWDDTAIQI